MESQSKPEEVAAKPEREQEEKIDVEAVMQKLKSLEQSNERLLDESKAWKSKYQSIRGEVEQSQNEELKQKNDFKGLYEKTLNEKEELLDTLRNEKKANLESTLKYEVAKNARDAVDTDLLLAAIKLKKKDQIGYDNDTGSWRGIDSAVADFRTEMPSLFSQDKPGMVNGRPKSALPKEKTVDERILDEPDTVLKEALAQMLKG